jgi:hypothetical protein
MRLTIKGNRDEGGLALVRNGLKPMHGRIIVG